MDLTFQVPMQYCFLQHWTLLPSPVISTTEDCFCYGSVSSFFVELFLYSSAVAYWVPTDPGSSSFSVVSFAFSYWSRGSQGFPDGPVIKRIRLPMQEVQETLVRSLGPEDPLEKEMAMHSSVLV